ncbi:aldo/keto reductase [Oscillospiraceae bacterium NSJ-54]|uniref:Aldo/keto reductase n=1 Tax=Zongyangia hominis TaxID=2763677 RepID=A0A926I6X2_9FIRM|nr:aldo/keto reductase [Zongyangia hominis]
MTRRPLGKSGVLVSQVGLGCEHLQGMEAGAIRAVVDEALKQGMNIFDIFMSEPQVRTDIGSALAGRRDQVLLQGHIGAAWLNGQYCRTRKIDECEHFFEDFLVRLRTDYVDIGMLHYVDTPADFEAVFHSPVIEYAKRLKKEGVIRLLGMSSHDPGVARMAVETGLIDVLMFSINPSFDLAPAGTDLDGLFGGITERREGVAGINAAREQLYRTCERMGVGITVMKPLGAGRLLSADTSPLGVSLTPAQCVHYALDRPAVSSVLVGCRTPEEVRAAAAYEKASAQERDYTEALAGAWQFAAAKGQCMYCNHCLPCPKHIDVAQVGKFLDLAAAEPEVPATIRAHYEALEHHASECIACRSCERNCPFQVPVVERMEKAAAIFGK